MVKLFISWSGQASRKIAIVLRNWIPDVIRGVEPFVSSEEIRKGKRWPLELANALEELRYGILCLTPTNVNAPWINFEAGALSKFLDDTLLAPVLFGIKSINDLPDPLSQFQGTKYERDDIQKMMWSINELAPIPMDRTQFDRVFATHWKDLKRNVDPLVKQIDEEATRSGLTPSTESPVLSEILDLVRSQQRIIDRATGDPFFTFRGNSRLEPLSSGDYRQLALGLAMLKNLAYTESHDMHKPKDAIVRTLFMIRDPLEVILARGYAPHIHSLYFDDERGPLRITYTEENRELDESLDDILREDADNDL